VTTAGLPHAARGDSASARLVADVMITRPKTHGLDTGIEDIRAFFANDHVHMALIVATDRRLVTTIERPDLAGSSPALSRAAELGTLAGRTADPAQPLDAVTGMLLRERRRRLAVVDGCGRLLGLLCLKKDGTGYCSEDNIRQRRQAGAQAWR
jgi:CBS-domain-containing membrane protein